MTNETSPYPVAPPPPPPPAATSRAATRGWNGSDLAIGGAVVVLLVALFLPWFSSTVRVSRFARISGAGDGPAAHGYLWLVFVLAIVALIILVARDAIAQVPGNMPSPEQILVGATGLSLLLTILGVVQKPSVVTVTGSGPISQVFPRLTISVGWSYGGWIALVAALIAFVAAFREAGALQSSRRMTMPSLRRRSSSA
jgi:uncharacterized membrane protein